MKKIDYLIVGAGLFGSTIARLLTDSGKECLVIDKRNHIGGNCYTEKYENIDVHKYGPHIFHTNNKMVWDFVNNFSTFNNFILHNKANYNGFIHSLPINLSTFQSILKINEPKAAKRYIEELIKIDNPINFEEIAISAVGEEIYKTLFLGYTKKQWGVHPTKLPISIFKRIPIRFNFNDNYFNDKYQGIPINGYTDFFKNLLNGININLNSDFINEREYFSEIADKIIYTGKIDEYYDYKFGELDYRSLKFEEQIINTGDFQGNAIINYTNSNIKYTRIVEHKHFNPININPNTIITTEFPATYKVGENDPYYPINNFRNNKIYGQYFNLKNKNIYFGGRLGEYKYLNMDEIILNAINLFKLINNEKK